MKKLAKAQMGKIIKSVGNALLKKRPAKQVFGAAGTVAGGLGTGAAISTYQAKKQYAEEQKKPEVIERRKKEKKLIEDMEKKYSINLKRKMGGATKSKKK